MKRLVYISKELDGHCESLVRVTTTKSELDSFIKSVLYNDDLLLYSFIGENKLNENHTTFFWSGDEGDLSISVVLFKNYKQLENKTFYNHTG